MTIEITIKGVRVGYENYIFVHGTAPRGTGNWAFELNGEFRSYEGTFASARAQAVKDALALGLHNIQVGA